MEQTGTQEAERELISTTLALGINSGRVEISGIDSGDVEFLWPTVEARIDEAFIRGCGISPDNILPELQKRAMQLWVIHKNQQMLAVFITRIEGTGKDKSLRVVALQGAEMDKWLQFGEETLRIFAAAHGCQFLEIIGRRGWLKTLKRLSWEEAYIGMRRYL